MLAATTLDHDSALDARAKSRLRWRCRRGMLENDLLIARFFSRFEATLTQRQASAMERLMDLSDNDLLDLLLARCEPEGDLAIAAVHDLLAQMRISA